MLSRLSLRSLLPQLRTPATLTTTQQRNYFKIGHKVVRKEKFVYRRKDKSKYKGNPNPTITAILREDVEKFGEKGTVVEVSRSAMRNYLVPNKLADYGIPENLAKWGITDYGEEKGDLSVKHGMKQGCPHVIRLLSKEDTSLVIKRRQARGPWMVTRHDVLNSMMGEWQLYVPLNRLQLKTTEGEVVDRITQYGTYTAEVTVSNEHIDPPLVIPVPFQVVGKSWKKNYVRKDVEDVASEVPSDNDTDTDTDEGIGAETVGQVGEKGQEA